MVCLLMMVSLVILICLSVLVKEPLVLGVLLVLSALVVCSVLSFWVSSLLSLVVFLSYVGGVMVLFVYVLSVNPNEFYSLNFSSFFFLSMFFVLLMSIYIWLLNFSFVISDKVIFSFIGVGSYWILSLYMGMMLLFSLLVVCYLCMKKRAPLRSLL
uniref:NADH dehydrogenase subunit 6 n=1 Tax=Geukensia demissa TaxID=27807 RepID=UPI001FAF1F3A|nr:NADH dehydrogenase subunit 6 [Geukensia demissa]UJM44217.1 NADH dehydrogenase subunit 6 [Geukensia demissa]